MPIGENGNGPLQERQCVRGAALLEAFIRHAVQCCDGLDVVGQNLFLAHVENLLLPEDSNETLVTSILGIDCHRNQFTPSGRHWSAFYLKLGDFGRRSLNATV
jgi:hypothetical protein